jgi:hypothetical protein
MVSIGGWWYRKAPQVVRRKTGVRAGTPAWTWWVGSGSGRAARSSSRRPGRPGAAGPLDLAGGGAAALDRVNVLGCRLPRRAQRPGSRGERAGIRLVVNGAQDTEATDEDRLLRARRFAFFRGRLQPFYCCCRPVHWPCIVAYQTPSVSPSDRSVMVHPVKAPAGGPAGRARQKPVRSSRCQMRPRQSWSRP